MLASRLTAPVRRDQMPWDRVFMATIMIVFCGWLVLIGLDARRFAWSHALVWAEGSGAVLLALGMGVAWLTFRDNTFAAPQVRV